MLGHGGKIAPVHGIETAAVDLETGERLIGDLGGDGPVAGHRGEITDPAQEPVGNPGRAPRAAGDFPGAVIGELDTEDAGAAAIVTTDISRDGALEGVNVEATAALARATELPVIASGGVAALADIEALMAANDAIPGAAVQGTAAQRGGIQGAIIGRALYDGRIDPAAALALVTAAERADA